MKLNEHYLTRRSERRSTSTRSRRRSSSLSDLDKRNKDSGNLESSSLAKRKNQIENKGGVRGSRPSVKNTASRGSSGATFERSRTPGRFRSLRRMLSFTTRNQKNGANDKAPRVEQNAAEQQEHRRLDSSSSKETVLLGDDSVPTNVNVLSDIKSFSDLDEGSTESPLQQRRRRLVINNNPDIMPSSESSPHHLVPMTPKTKLIHEQQEEIEMLRATIRHTDSKKKAQKKKNVLHIVKVSSIEWTIVSSEGAKTLGSYSGPAVDGKTPHGRGTLKLKNGDIYKGPFKFGEMHGRKATLLAANGDVYTGKFWHNLKHGSAEVVFSTGHRYVGSYQFGRAQGFGVEYDASGLVVHLGQWHTGNPVVKEETKTVESSVLKDTMAKCNEREDVMRRYIERAISAPDVKSPVRALQLAPPCHSRRQLVKSPVVAADILSYATDDDSISTSESSGVDVRCSIYNCN